MRAWTVLYSPGVGMTVPHWRAGFQPAEADKNVRRPEGGFPTRRSGQECPPSGGRVVNPPKRTRMSALRRAGFQPAEADKNVRPPEGGFSTRRSEQECPSSGGGFSTRPG